MGFQNCCLFKLKHRKKDAEDETHEERMKRGRAFTPADSALKKLVDKWGYHPWSDPLEVALGFIEALLTILPKWRDADEGVGEQLGDFVSSLEGAFVKTVREFADAFGNEARQDAAASKLLKKMKQFKPRIREAFDFLPEYAFQTTHPPPISNSDDLAHSIFCMDAVTRLLRLDDSLEEKFVAFFKSLRSIYACYTGSDIILFGSFSNQIGGALLSSAQLESCFCAG